MRSPLSLVLLTAIACKGGTPAPDPQRAADSAAIEALGGTFSDSAYQRADSAAKVAQVKTLVRNATIEMEQLYAGGYPSSIPPDSLALLDSDSLAIELGAKDEYTLTVTRPGVARCTWRQPPGEMTCDPLPR